jgi:hypothetical protein
MVAIESLQANLNDERLFGSLKTDRTLIEEGNIVLGSNLNNSANNNEDEILFEETPPATNGTDDEDSDDEAQTPSNTMITWHWNKRNQCIEHEYSIAAWALCIMGSVWTDVRD